MLINIGHDGKFRPDEKILQEEKKIIEVEVKKKTVFAKRTFPLFVVNRSLTFPL